MYYIIDAQIGPDIYLLKNTSNHCENEWLY